MQPEQSSLDNAVCETCNRPWHLTDAAVLLGEAIMHACKFIALHQGATLYSNTCVAALENMSSACQARLSSGNSSWQPGELGEVRLPLLQVCCAALHA